jgi:DNA-binding NtrC family response regulator
MITVYSEIGHGSTFNIYLPSSRKNVATEASMKGGLLKGTETVLLVDDESMITDVAQAMLKKLDYKVIVVNDGESAVETIRRMGKKIDLVILDMIMPGMDGGKTFDLVREILPSVPVILSSGYSINGQAMKIMERGCKGFIQKPFNIRELAQKIREILDWENNPDRG